MERTEDQILAKAPIKVMLGSKEYEIKPLTIKAQREWREKMSRDMQEIVTSFQADAGSRAALGTGLTVALTKFPEKLTDLVLSYDPSLPRETILEEATEEQISVVFGKLMKIAFPFLAHLQTVRSAIQATA